MLHHLSFAVSDLQRSKSFYDAALGALGYVRVWETPSDDYHDAAIGYGVTGGEDQFALKLSRQPLPVLPPGLHLAFTARDRDAVHKFHTAALTHGGRDNGAPGLRPQYGAHYYAAFVLDPEGYRIEAVINQAP